jgi:hypothetical protein
VKGDSPIRYVDSDGQWHSFQPRERKHLIRQDGRVEWLCEHGIGHCIGHVVAWEDWMGVHGCDGCCVNREGK